MPFGVVRKNLNVFRNEAILSLYINFCGNFPLVTGVYMA
jgi:hypothetical protein